MVKGGAARAEDVVPPVVTVVEMMVEMINIHVDDDDHDNGDNDYDDENSFDLYFGPK